MHIEQKNYSSEFYTDVESTSTPSAEIVVPIIIELLEPKTVVDVGCGSGTWLHQFRKHDCSVIGYDGPWVDEAQLLIPSENFRRNNLENNIDCDQRFDLAICLEVAEHLSIDSADLIVNSLCNLSPIVCFSAAIPGQGGTNHLNEQWQSYWVQKFKRKGYGCYDVIRPKIWNNEKVAVHYVQNMLLFIDENNSRLTANQFQEYDIKNRMSDIVHPRLLADKTHPLSNSFRKFFFSFLPAFCKARFNQLRAK